MDRAYATDVASQCFVVGYFDAGGEFCTVRGLTLDGVPIARATFNSRAKAAALQERIHPDHRATITEVWRHEYSEARSV